MPLTHRPVKAGDHVFLVDGSSFVFRAYFQSIRQDPKYNYRSDQLPTGAVRLFCTKLFQFVREGAAGIKPTHLAIIFDKSENSFRKEIYPPYKANRSEPPEDLIPQFPLMRAAVRAFGLVPIEQDRYEADDLIATYACQARERGADVLIISADKDLMQLVGQASPCTIRPPAKREPRARAKSARSASTKSSPISACRPEKVIDVQALAGDSTDNVPGARGIGIKTAAQLIGEYGDLDTLLARAYEIKQPKRREILTDPESVALIKLSKQLVSLVRDVPLEVPLDDLGLHRRTRKRSSPFSRRWNSPRSPNAPPNIFGVAAEAIEPDPAFAGAAGWRGRDGEATASPDALEATATEPRSRRRQRRRYRAKTHAMASRRKGKPSRRAPAELAAARAAAAPAMPFDRTAYATITTFDQLDACIAAAFEAGACRGRHGNLVARSDAGRARRHLALRRAGQGLLHPAAAQGRGRRRSFRRRRPPRRPIAGR